MTEKELRGLSRNDLLEMLLSQTAKNEELEAKLKEAEKKLQTREIIIANAGTMAEAAMQMNGVLQAVDKAAAQYLSNVMRMYEEQESKCATLEADCAARSEQLLSETINKCNELEKSTQERCDAMLRKAEEESQAYWANAQDKLQQFCASHESLMALLQAKG